MTQSRAASWAASMSTSAPTFAGDYAVRANRTGAGDEDEVAGAGGAGVLAVRAARGKLYV